MTNLTNNELADKVREAHDNILEYGWRKGYTDIGEESEGLCIGSALAMAFDEKGFTCETWDYQAFTYSTIDFHTEGIELGESLCDNGKALTPYLRDAINTVSNSILLNSLDYWNDHHSTTEDMVLDVLMNTEKALREVI